jgi:Lar family restriction alleviation protein
MERRAMELKPCLFCGSKADTIKGESAFVKVYFKVFCTSPDCNVRTQNTGTKKKAIEIWNRRFAKKRPVRKGK